MLGRIIQTHYKIIQLLGSGSFGQTYLAKNLQLVDEPVCVIKQLKPQNNDSASFKVAKALFDREAETLRQVESYQQIPRILDYFEEAHEFYLVQEYIEGKTLREELQHQKLWSENEAILFLQDVLQILEFIHNQNIIHRDIKPENIIRRTQDQKLFLIDFGAVKQISRVTPEQSSPTIVHSQGYSPPEQLAGIPEPNSDIYALGMTCIQALTGARSDSLIKLRNTKTQKISWSEDIQISHKFKLILDKMVCLDCRQRYPNAGSVMQDLRSLSQDCVASDVTHKYTPTEIVKNELEQFANPQLYTPTEVSHSTNSNSDADWEECQDLEHSVSKNANTQIKQKLSFSQLSLELNQCLDGQDASKLEEIIDATKKILSKKLIILSSSLLLIGIGLLSFATFIYQTRNSTDQLPQASAVEPPVANLEKRHDFTDHTSAIKFLDFTADGKTLISVSEAGFVKFRDLQNQFVKTLTQTPSRILAISGSSNGEVLAIATENKSIEIWNLKTGKKMNRIATKQLIWSLALSSNGQILAAGGLDSIGLWKGVQSKPTLFSGYQLSQGSFEPVRAIALNSATDVLVGGSTAGTLKISNLATSQSQTFHKHSKVITSSAIDANGALLFTASEDDTIRLWNLYALKEHTLPVIQTDLGGVKAVASSPNGRIVAGGGAYGLVKLWDWHTGQLVASASNHTTEITALAFSPDGRMLATGDRDGKIVVYASR
ncbi:protein kinase domain-containing protein [Phormidesmis priestleyi]